MALINTAIKPFKATAFKDGEFVDVSSEDIKGKWAVFVFYPADFTFVCPTELGDIADKYEELQSRGVEVFSVSTDTHFTHKAWHDSSDTINKIKFAMIGDPTGEITRNFDLCVKLWALLIVQRLLLTQKVSFKRWKSLLKVSVVTQTT